MDNLENRNEEKLDLMISKILEEMETIREDSDEFAKLSMNLDRLWKIKNSLPKKEETALVEPMKWHERFLDSMDPELILKLAVGLFETWMVLHYEDLHVITSKAFSRVFKRRV